MAIAELVAHFQALAPVLLGDLQAALAPVALIFITASEEEIHQVVLLAVQIQQHCHWIPRFQVTQTRDCGLKPDSLSR